MGSVLEATERATPLAYRQRLRAKLSHNCPCDAPKPPVLRQQQPSRSIGEVFEAVDLLGKLTMVERQISV
jgi:hypothetical protein